MSFGIGLGSFVDGLKSGIGIRRDQETYDLAKEDRLRRIQREEEDRAFQLSQRERTLEQQKREDERQQKLDEEQAARDAVIEGARTEFGEKVASGELSDQDFDKFWNDYTIPRLRNIMLEQQDYAGAQALDAWAQSADAKKGAKLVGRSLLKAQTGDHEGALRDVIEVSKINGYLDSGYEITGFEPMENGAGQTLGYRLQIQAGDEVIEQDIAINDIPQVISTFANPAAAWQSQLDAQAARVQKESELAEFQTKEQIKANVKKPSEDAKLRTDAIKSITDEEKDLLDDEDTPKFYDLPREVQEQKINERISVMTGEQPMVVPRAQVIADTELGQVVPVGITQQQGDDDVLPERNDEETLPEFDALDLPTPKSALERAKKYGN